MLRMEIMRRMLRLRMLLKKNLRILKIMNLNWKNFDDRGDIFPFLRVLYFTTLYWLNYTYT